MRILPALPEHAPGIFAITDAVRFDPATADGDRGFLILPGSPAWWAEALSEPSPSRVALEGDLVVGFVYALLEQDGDLLKIDRIAVRPTHAGRGIAQRLLDAALADARASRAYAWIMHEPIANRRSIAFFRGNGFRPTREACEIGACTLGRYELP